MQVSPSPVYPGLQVHVKDPTVLRHIALTSQLSELLEHSFTSKGNKTFLNEKNSD